MTFRSDAYLPILFEEGIPIEGHIQFQGHCELNFDFCSRKIVCGTFLSSRVSHTVILTSVLSSRKLYPKHFLCIFLKNESKILYVGIFWCPIMSHTVLGSL